MESEESRSSDKNFVGKPGNSATEGGRSLADSAGDASHLFALVELSPPDEELRAVYLRRVRALRTSGDSSDSSKPVARLDRAYELAKQHLAKQHLAKVGLLRQDPVDETIGEAITSPSEMSEGEED